MTSMIENPSKNDQVIASRESLAEPLEDNESDHKNLMAHEFPTDIDIDPFTLPEVHEHMIRSPPPVDWPKSPNFRMFQFPGEDDTIQVEVDSKLKSPKTECKPKHSWSDVAESTSPLRSTPRSHMERFSLLSPSMLRTNAEDSVRLVSADDS